MKSVFFTITLLTCMSCTNSHKLEDLHSSTKQYKAILHEIESVTDSIQLELKRGKNNSKVVSSTEYFKQEVAEIQSIQQDCESALSKVFSPSGEIVEYQIGELKKRIKQLQDECTDLQHLHKTLQLMNSMQ